MTVSEVAAYLRAHDKYLILTHRRPDGDTLRCGAVRHAAPDGQDRGHPL